MPMPAPYPISYIPDRLKQNRTVLCLYRVGGAVAGKGTGHWHRISPGDFNGQVGMKATMIGEKHLIDLNVHFFNYK